MRVQCLDVCEMKLPSGAEREHPEGWVGDVPDDVGQAWVDARKAKKLKKASLTEEQTEVLANAADKAIAENGADLTREPDIAELSVSELRAMAVGRSIEGAAKMTRAALLKALSPPSG